jgi:protein SCO1
MMRAGLLLARAAVVCALVLVAPSTVADGADGARDTGRSIYQLDAPWTDDAGKPLRLRDLKGVQVLTLIFTSCAGACPATVKALQMVARDRSVGIGDDAQVLLVSVDPERDTVEALRRYRREMHLDKSGWKLLRGAEPDVRKLAAVLGFNYEQIDSGEFVHSNLVTVLNARGEIVHQQNGVGSDSTVLKDAIRRAAIEDSQ